MSRSGAQALRADASKIVRDENAGYEQLAIVERYEQFINYIYPVAQNVARAHGIAKEMFLRALFEQVTLFIAAGKSSQPSRLYAADANLATLRFWLRFMVDSKRRLITPQQHRTAQVHLAEVGKMLGTWIKTAKGRG